MNNLSEDLFHDIDEARIPMKFMASLFGAGHEGRVRYALRKQKAVRWYRRALTVGDVPQETVDRMLREADCSREEAEAIYPAYLALHLRTALRDSAHASRRGHRDDERHDRAQAAGRLRLSAGPRRSL